jgi:hypothetical protein
MRRVLGLIVIVACGPPPRGDGYSDAATGGGGDDGGIGGTDDSGVGAGSDGGGGGGTDGGMVKLDAGPSGVITGGPCSSGTAGAAAYRIRFANSGGTAYVVYEVNGLPDKSPDMAGAYGYQIGFTPSYVDPYLAQGGLQLDSSSFVDLELSTIGVSQITKATLSLYGRSFNTTTSGSFNWQTFDDTGSTPTSSVSNAAPYAWYSGDMTSALSPGDGGVRIRIKAGPNSGALVVNKIELCLQAS